MDSLVYKNRLSPYTREQHSLQNLLLLCEGYGIFGFSLCSPRNIPGIHHVGEVKETRTHVSRKRKKIKELLWVTQKRVSADPIKDILYFRIS